MKIATILIAFAFSIAAPAIYASGNHADGHTHEHKISSKQAERRAQKVIDQLIEKKAVDASWKGSKPVESVQKTAEGKKFWQVSFKSAANTDPAKQTLYVFLSASGKYLAANHSGKY